ncbi:MAG: hypothetical protein M1834_002105 [Cirrosporium novae-zelandiae]|nr:MAG: hypothetical protein M1834_002105 [Cirrosporium novae-zelandiae]
MSQSRFLAEAENAQDCGSGFGVFLSRLPDQAAELTALIAEFFAISSALRKLDDLIQRSRIGQSRIQEDIRLVIPSLSYTLKDVTDYFADLNAGASFITVGRYRQIWQEISKSVREESDNTLCQRLRKYRVFIDELCFVVRGEPVNQRFLIDTRATIRAWLNRQEYHQPIEPLALDTRPPPADAVRRQQSYERQRPQPQPLPRSPQSPYSPHSPPPINLNFNYVPPFVPDAPGSPTFSNTSDNWSSSSISGNSDHWVTTIFRDNRSSTPLPREALTSACYDNYAPGVVARLNEEGWVHILQISFAGGGLDMRLYYNYSDRRTRIVCRMTRPSGQRVFYYRTASSLTLHRGGGSMLQLCLRSDRSLWANLVFSTYELMVLFHCTFLGLCGEDRHCFIDPKHCELKGEEELYGGQISDNGFRHALRIFRDGDSQGIRLEASILEKDLLRVPVWTAFITNLVPSKTWLRKVTSKVVRLQELKVHVFSEEYEARSVNGATELSFVSSNDAKSFVNIMDDLSRRP